MTKPTKATEFAKNFTEEAKRAGTVKGLGGAVGIPDKEDWANIHNIISVFRKESIKKYGFDILVDCIATARKEKAQYGGKYDKLGEASFNLVNKDSNMRYHFEFPESFVQTIELAYPLMFKDREHYHWFCKNFAQLGVAERF